MPGLFDYCIVIGGRLKPFVDRCSYMGVFAVWGDIGLSHRSCRWVYGAQCKCECWFYSKLSCELVGWLNILGFPVNLSGDWLMPNIKHRKLSTVLAVGKEKFVNWGRARKKVGCMITNSSKICSSTVICCSCVWRKKGI